MDKEEFESICENYESLSECLDELKEIAHCDVSDLQLDIEMIADDLGKVVNKYREYIAELQR